MWSGGLTSLRSLGFTTIATDTTVTIGVMDTLGEFIILRNLTMRNLINMAGMVLTGPA